MSVELAYSLAALPTKHLLDTFRKRYGPSNIQCHDPKSKGCQTHSCPLAAIPSFLKGKSCPEPNCSINADSLLFRPEQKLVDSMMLSDLLFYAHENHSPLAIVSSDDDLWPGILSALHVGAEIRHIRTQRASRFSPHYATIHPRRYISAVIS